MTKYANILKLTAWLADRQLVG